MARRLHERGRYRFFFKDKFKTGMGKKIQGGDVLMLPDGWQDVLERRGAGAHLWFSFSSGCLFTVGPEIVPHVLTVRVRL